MVNVFLSGFFAVDAVATRLTHTEIANPGFNVETSKPVPCVVGVVNVVGDVPGVHTLPVFTTAPAVSRAIERVAPPVSIWRK